MMWLLALIPTWFIFGGMGWLFMDKFWLEKFGQHLHDGDFGLPLMMITCGPIGFIAALTFLPEFKGLRNGTIRNYRGLL
jgi:hypothetical protein